MWFKKNKKIIGRLEYIDIPTLYLQKVRAKIDTGAYRGALHASEVKEIEENGVKKLQFKIINDSHEDLKNKIYKVDNYQVHKFRGTQSDLHDRYVIPLEIVLAGERIKVELSLSDRSALRYPVLIGRRVLKNRFLVDVDKKY